MRSMLLLKALMVRGMRWLLVRILVLKIIHHRHPLASCTAINSAMLRLLMALAKHSVQARYWGVRIGGSGGRRGLCRKSACVGRSSVSNDVSRVLLLYMLGIIVISRGLWKSITIGHLKMPQSRSEWP